MNSVYQVPLSIGRLILAFTMGFISSLVVQAVYGGLIYGILWVAHLNQRVLLTPPAPAVILVYGALGGLMIAELMIRLDQYLLGDRPAVRWRLVGLVGGGFLALRFSPSAAIYVTGPLLGLLHGWRWLRASRRADEDQARTDEFADFLKRRQEEANN